MVDEILLLSGNPIPFPGAKTSVRQPMIKEIALLGEESFFIGCQLLNFSKEILNEEDRISLAEADDFEILMSILLSSDVSLQQSCASLVLMLLFPQYSVEYFENRILLKGEESTEINADNFLEFKEILRAMFQLQAGSAKDEYRPKNEAARRIAEKLQQGRQKAAEAKGERQKKTHIFSRYISILSVALHIDVNTLLGYSVYQLFDSFKRYQMYHAFDIYIQAKMAGASDLDEVDNWMDEIHS